jgi:hypothetical protein
MFLLGLSAFLFGLMFFVKQPSVLGAVFVLGILGVIILAVRSRAEFVVFTPAEFDRMYSLWKIAHGEPAGVILRNPKPAPPPDAEPDIGDYSFDRAIICDRARTADLLLANNFHFENNCAVLTIGGYPKGPFETVRRMLKRNPKLQVFALHDATELGCKLAHRLATEPEWFAGLPRVIDVGLRPRHAGRYWGVIRRHEGTKVEPGDGISNAEAVWLSRRELELAVIRPEVVLKRLFRAINRAANLPAASDAAFVAGGDGTQVVDDDSFDIDPQKKAVADGGDTGGGGSDAFG